MEVIVDKPDYIKERIKFETEFFKQAFTFFLLISSATATLFARFLGNFSFVDGMLMVISAGITGVVIGVLREKHKAIYKLINDLNKDPQ